jgi:penicillin-binding protein 1C
MSSSSISKTPTFAITQFCAMTRRLKPILLLLLPLLLLLAFLSIRVGSLFDDPTSTVLLARHDELLGARIAADGQWRFPHNQLVPQKFEKCIIAFEDKRFFYHPGIDPLAVIRALRSNIKAKANVSGGSTITMQVIRLSRKGKPRTIGEKLVEAVMASRLEVRFSKKEILSLYASNAPFGGNVVGLDAAAWRYFGRNATELSWAEAATLAVLPNAPSMIHPGRNRELLMQKRNLLLERLMKNKTISVEDYDLALLETLPGQPLSLPMDAFHLLERMHLAQPGTIVHSTLQAGLQSNTNRIVNNYVAQYRSNQVHNAAALIIDNRSGEVIAYTGNVFDPGNMVPGAMVDVITAPRSGGSILKPFLFAGMLDEGLMGEKTLVADYPFQTPGFNPQNFDRSFDGAVPAYRALQRSLNVPAVRMLQQFGVERFYFLMQQLGMRTLKQPPSHYGLSLILGGAESTLWDVTAMYARLSRVLTNFSQYDGLYHPDDMFEPILLLPSEPKENSEIGKIRPMLEPTGVLDASAIWVTYKALLEVNRPEEESGWKIFNNARRIAWKTGTSYGNRDAWAVGTTPEFTVGVWIGNASGEGRPNLTGVGFAAPVLFDLFGLLPHTSSFPQPYDDMVAANICRQSGHIAGAYCTETDSVWIPLKTLRTISCPYHTVVHLDATGRFRVNSDCYEVHRMQKQSWFILPPAMEWFYRAHNPDYRPLPPWYAGCDATLGRNPMQLIYPAGNVTVSIPRELGGDKGKLVLQAAHRNAEAVIFWHIDGEYIGATHTEHYLAISPAPGKRKVVLVDESGYMIEQEFTVAQGSE